MEQSMAELQFSNFFAMGADFQTRPQWRVDQTAPNLGRTEFHHRWRKWDTLVPTYCFV